MARTTCRITALVSLVAIVGCAQDTTVTGKVTFNGQAVERGSIRFVSTDKQGPTFGAVIKGGQYIVENAVPGPKVATIQVMDEKALPTSSAELEEMAAQAKSTGTRTARSSELPALIPADAEGNNQTVEIKQGAQTLDFHLKSPPQ